MSSFWSRFRNNNDASKDGGGQKAELVETWLEQESEEKPQRLRAITPAALEMFGDAAVASNQQLQHPPRCQSSLGDLRLAARSLDLKCPISPSPHQPPAGTPSPGSSLNRGPSPARDLIGGMFELPGRCHSSLDFTSSRQHHGAKPLAALPPKPGASLMAQRSAKSITGYNAYQAYQAWASQGNCASPDPTAICSLPHTQSAPRPGSLLHTAAAHRAGATSLVGTPAPASRADSPSGRASPAQPAPRVRSSLDRARDILQGGQSLHQSRAPSRAAEDGTRGADGGALEAEATPSAALRRTGTQTTFRSSLAPLACPTPDAGGQRSCDSPNPASRSATPCQAQPPGRQRHSLDQGSARQAPAPHRHAPAAPSCSHGGGSGDLVSISQTSDGSTLEAIQRDAELELEMLDQRVAHVKKTSSRPDSPTLYAHHRLHGCTADPAGARAGEAGGWLEPPLVCPDLRTSSAAAERISLEAGIAGAAGPGGPTAFSRSSTRNSIDLSHAHRPRPSHDRNSGRASVDLMEGWRTAAPTPNARASGWHGHADHHPSQPPRARMGVPSPTADVSSSSFFASPSPPRGSDPSVHQRCPSPTAAEMHNSRHSAPTIAGKRQGLQQEGSMLAPNQPSFYSQPGGSRSAASPGPACLRAHCPVSPSSRPTSHTPPPHSSTHQLTSAHQLPLETIHSSLLFVPSTAQPRSHSSSQAALPPLALLAGELSPEGSSLFGQVPASPPLSGTHPLHVQAMRPGSGSERSNGWRGSSRTLSPQLSPKGAEARSQRSSLDVPSRTHSSDAPTIKPKHAPLPPLHPPSPNHAANPPTMHPRPPTTAPPSSSRAPSSSGSSTPADAHHHRSRNSLDDEHEQRSGHAQGQQVSAARGLWSKLGAGSNLKKLSSKNLAQTFLDHLQAHEDDFLVEAARNRAKSLNGDEELGEQTTRSRDGFDMRQNHFTPALPLSKAASRKFGIDIGEGAGQEGDEEDDDDMLTPLECESMTARQQKIWAKTRLTLRRMQIMKANPVAFDEKAAQAAETEARAAAEHARKRFKDLCAMVSDSKASGQFRDAVQHMQVNRPYFIPPMASKRLLVSRAVVNKKDEKAWRLEDSIFMKRVRENDARNVYDTPEVADRQFEMDWSRVSSKVRFRKMVTRQDQGLKDAAELERELNEVHDELQKRYTTIRAAFIYYSSFSGSTGSDNMLSMGLMEFHRFARQCNITDPKTPGIKPSDIDTMFISTNFEEDSHTEESEANDDNALVRFELLEIIVRMAIGKFIVPKVLSDVSDSVSHLFDNFIEPGLPEVAKVDTNDFRRNRFYCKEMEMEVVSHWDLLQAMFKLYKAKDRTKLFWIEHWIALLESTNLLGGHTGIDKHCAKVVFAFSQSTVVDELRRRQRAISLMFFDFLEALARLSEVLNPPTPAELAALANPQQQQQQVPPEGPETGQDPEGAGKCAERSQGLDAGEEEPAAAQPPLTPAEYYKRLQVDPVLRAARAEKAGLGRELHLAAEKRPLAECFAGLIEVMLPALQDAWGGTKEAQTAARMQKMAQGISGGIELNG